MNDSQTCGIIELDNTKCPNTARYIPVVHVYVSKIQSRQKLAILVPQEIEFHQLPLCHHHKQEPESMIKTLWGEVTKELSQHGLIPSNRIKPFITFEKKAEPETQL